MTDTAVAPPEVPTTDVPVDDPRVDEQDAPIPPKLAPEDVLVGNPAVPGPGNPSPDGSVLAYLMADPGDPTGPLSLWMQPLDGGEPWVRALPFTPVIVPDATGDTSGDEGPVWSPDGTTLALTGRHPDDGRAAIWLLTAATGETHLLVDHPGEDRAPRWSPDGALIAFVAHRAGRDTVNVIPADGSGPALTISEGLTDDRDPAWSRDGTEIAFRRATPGHPTHGDIWVIKLATGVVKQVTNIPGKATSKAANRRLPKWAPNRSLIAFITDEKDYDAIAVVNPDNNAGWTLADEAGDKSGVQWAANGLRILYTRKHGPVSNACARGTSASRSDVIDPGDGLAFAPRWTGDGRAVYAYGAPDRAVRHHTQEAKLDVERAVLPAAIPWDGPEAGLLAPSVYTVETGDGTKLSGQLFRKPEVSGPTPAVVSLGEGPPHRQEAGFSVLHQALALAGIAVFAPNLRGVPGAGRAITDGLQTFAGQEVEAADLADVATALRGLPDVIGDRIAITGRGFGATLALLAAAARPGHYATVVAVDPIVDWDWEIDSAPEPWRSWLLRQFGPPVLGSGPYALRTPETFAGLLALLDVPPLLIGTAGARAGRDGQLAYFAVTLDEIEIPYRRATAATDADVARLTLEYLLHGTVTDVEGDVPAEVVAPVAHDEAVPVVAAIEAETVEALEPVAELESKPSVAVEPEGVAVGDGEIMDEVEVVAPVDAAAEIVLEPVEEPEPVTEMPAVPPVYVAGGATKPDDV